MIPGIESARLYPEVGQPTWTELIIVNGIPPQIQIHREIIDPAMYLDVNRLTAVFKCRNGYTPYTRNWLTGALTQIDWSVPLTTGLTVVLVGGTLYGGQKILRDMLSSTAQILPARMLWPVQ